MSEPLTEIPVEVVAPTTELVAESSTAPVMDDAAVTEKMQKASKQGQNSQSQTECLC